MGFTFLSVWRTVMVILIVALILTSLTTSVNALPYYQNRRHIFMQVHSKAF